MHRRRTAGSRSAANTRSGGAGRRLESVTFMSAASRDSGLGIRDSRPTPAHSGFGIRDSGFAFRLPPTRDLGFWIPDTDSPRIPMSVESQIPNSESRVPSRAPERPLDRSPGVDLRQ